MVGSRFTGIAQRLFRAGDRNRGRNIFREGRIEQGRTAGESRLFTVRGTDLYSIEVLFIDTPRGLEAEVTCTCPRMESGFACKHAWAVLLELDRLEAAGTTVAGWPLIEVGVRSAFGRYDPEVPWYEGEEELWEEGQALGVFDPEVGDWRALAAHLAEPGGLASPRAPIFDFWFGLSPESPFAYSGSSLEVQFLGRERRKTGSLGVLKVISLPRHGPLPPVEPPDLAALADELRGLQEMGHAYGNGAPLPGPRYRVRWRPDCCRNFVGAVGSAGSEGLGRSEESTRSPGTMGRPGRSGWSQNGVAPISC